MKPSGGVFPSLAKPLIFVLEMTEKISLPLIISTSVGHYCERMECVKVVNIHCKQCEIGTIYSVCVCVCVCS